MKNAIRAASSLLILLSLSCGSPQNTGLTVTVIPNQPFAIPFGTTTVLGVAVTAPYFILNSINLAWAGTGNLEIVAIIMSSPVNNSTTTGTTTTPTVNCGIAGDQLAAAYPTYSNNGNVVIPTNTTAVSGQMPCAGFSLPTPLPQTLNIPVTIQVVGVIIDPTSGNPTGRVTQSQNITVQ